MDYLLDTNHWSYLQRGNPSVVKRVRALPSESTLFMPVIVQAELLLGVELTASEKRRTILREFYESAIGESARILPVDSSVAERFALIAAQLRRDGPPIATNDIWIAAIAQARGLTLVTNDADFRFVAGVTTEDWSK